MHLDRTGARRRWPLFAAVAVIAVVAAACVPPPPPPPPPTTTTQPPNICGVNALSASGVDAAHAVDDNGGASTRYAAVVQHGGRSQVYTRDVSSPAELARFRADVAAQGDVTAFEADGEVHALGETATWGFTDSGFATAWANSGNTGTGVRVAEIDTGVDTSHPDLVGHFGDPSDPTSGVDIVTANAPTLLSPPQPAIDPPPVDTTDPSTSGHGTHVAGILAATAGNGIGVEGGAPGVTLVPVRVLGANGAGLYSDVAEGIYWAADVTKGNAAVITMSLGGSASSSVVSQAIADVTNPANPNYSHPVITVAAGNSSCKTPSFPASLASSTPQMLSVSALCKVGTTDSCPTATPWSADLPYKLATYSSKAWSGTGTPTGIAAPGTDIESTLPGNDYGELSGTSMATPFVAAAAALVKQTCPSYTATQVVQRLENTAHDMGRPGVDTLYGYGKLDVAAALAGSC